MKLLIDENISHRLLGALSAFFPGSEHVRQAGLRGQSDEMIWDYAKRNGLTIVSKDNDFRQMAFTYGSPPKVIWLAVGNAGTDAIGRLLMDRVQTIRAFLEAPEESLLVLEMTLEHG